MTHHPKSRLAWLIALCSLALFAPLAWPLVTGRMFVYGDLHQFHVPYRYLYQQALLAGDSVLWTSNIFSGYYIHGEGQGGFYHPFHQLLYRVFPLVAALNLELLASFVAAFPGMYWLLRRLRLDAGASLFGAMLFAFGGFTMMHHDHLNLVAIYVQIPWLLVAIDVLLTAVRRLSLAIAWAGISLLVGSTLLIGFPQGAWWAFLTGTAFAIYRGWRTTTWKRLGAGAGAALTGILLAGVQLLPTADMAATSIRPLLTRDFALTFSLHPLNVLQFWSPYVFETRVYSALDYPFVHEFTIYSGAVLMVALPWLWIRRHALPHRRSILTAAALFAALTFVLALGRYGGLHVILSHLPILEALRAPVRYIGLFQLSLVVLAAVAFEDLVSFSGSGHRLTLRQLAMLCIPAALSILTTVLLNGRVAGIGAGVPFSSPARAAVGTALMLAVTLLVVLAARHRKWAVTALVAMTALDIGLWGIREAWRLAPQTFESLTSIIPPPVEEPGGRNVYVMDTSLPGNFVVLKGYRLASGYVGLPPATYFHISSSISQQLSGTHWDLSLSGGRTPLPGPVERARLLDGVEVTREFGKDFARVDLHQAALVDHPIAPLSGPPGTAHVVVDRPGYIVVETTTPGRQILALTERYHRGWQATQGGAPLETIAVHGDFVGAVVEAGSHRVTFRFMPRSFVVGRRLSFAGLAVLAMGIAVILLTA